MTYTIADPAGAKGRAAAAFGAELVRACAARDVSYKELARVLGVGLTALGHYRQGRTLPRVAAAATLAVVLDWPKLGDLVVAARTRACRRAGCGRQFVNDVGSEGRRYCSPACGRIALNIKQAERRARSAGQTGSPQARRAHTQRLRAAVRFADARATAALDAIAAMCRACEPEGLCRMADCPLRGASPLPLAVVATGVLRTHTAVRATTTFGPAARAARSAKMLAHHADPGYAARHSASLRAAAARRSPEAKAATVARAKASYPAARRSEVSKRVHAERRARGLVYELSEAEGDALTRIALQHEDERGDGD